MNEALHTTHPYPADRSFVLKLHRDADLAGRELRGRLVHLVSDKRSDFVGATGLLLALQALIAASVPLGAAAAAAAAAAIDTPPPPLPSTPRRPFGLEFPP